MRNLSLVNAYEVEAGIGVIAGNTVWSMPELLECEVLQKARYINTLTFTFTYQLSHTAARWFSGHVIRQVVNNQQDMNKMSDKTSNAVNT